MVCCRGFFCRMQVKLLRAIGKALFLLAQRVDLGYRVYIAVYGKCALIRNCDQPPLGML